MSLFKKTDTQMTKEPESVTELPTVAVFTSDSAPVASIPPKAEMEDFFKQTEEKLFVDLKLEVCHIVTELAGLRLQVQKLETEAEAFRQQVIASFKHLGHDADKFFSK